MKRAILAAIMLAGLAAPAAAQFQYYPDGTVIDRRVNPNYIPPQRGYDRRDIDRRDRWDDRRDRRRDWDDRRDRRGGGWDDRRAGGYGRTCVTSRGACGVYRPLPLRAPCSCDIPGFGTKRGAITR